MYKVGFVDNSFDLFSDYQTRLRRHDIELLFPAAGNSKEEIVNWVLSNDIRCLLIDHKLSPDFDFAGTDLFAYINGALPDLPCMILTAYAPESLQENLVIQSMIENRDALDASNLTSIVEKIKQAVEVFNKRLELREVEYQVLLKAKQNDAIAAQQEERLDYLYQLLRSYGEVDELPTELLKPEMEQKIDLLIEKLNSVLGSVSSGRGDI